MSGRSALARGERSPARKPSAADCERAPLQSAYNARQSAVPATTASLRRPEAATPATALDRRALRRWCCCCLASPSRCGICSSRCRRAPTSPATGSTRHLPLYKWLSDMTVTDGHGPRSFASRYSMSRCESSMPRGSSSCSIGSSSMINDGPDGCGTPAEVHRTLQRRAARSRLIERRKALPGLKVLRHHRSDQRNVRRMAVGESRGAARCRDRRRVTRPRSPAGSEPAYSALWRRGGSWWTDDGPGEGLLPNPVEPVPASVSAACGCACSTSRRTIAS